MTASTVLSRLRNRTDGSFLSLWSKDSVLSIGSVGSARWD
ncbi:hypothetical protein EES37_37165 [Streptomyces sp. ADI91-18]|nr:hypothetical protein EES37_37165 [Streptomyces sp. ADI91-18]